MPCVIRYGWLQVEVIDGVLCKGDRVTASSSGENYEILEVGPDRCNLAAVV